ncbi:MAG: A/G-specific adenine glycosylase [Candidatus Krumholzibacteria bacterium]|nr:A/G-specific adenine glycosylase [Candidatus Krumholzibacteria bacterium]MDH4337043.1 A/G-specific adenine glycosylase [Candidatus Krumholzibacteria bacterium]MDH5268580.1 A/G-specific adenine glycosylase [Candidatus Krumholzibacteria bacterium]
MSSTGKPHNIKITKKLLAWYRRSRRDLPWRRTRDAYHIWVSEVMLQQTQVATVVPFYERFVARFPDVASLARAPLDDVLKQWEGLGYYARARNLHAAAREVVNRFGGSVPGDADAFRTLPGVGEYIGAAVPSIAFGVPTVVVDGNVKRVIARLFATAESVDRPAGAREIRRRADSLLDHAHPGDFNQALMELGATVCRPTGPSCGACPVAGACAALAAGTPEAFPRRDPRRAVPVQRIAVGVVRRNGRVLITRRAESGMLGGLWEFPGGKIGPDESAEQACRREIREEVNLDVEVGERVARVKHAYTHLKVEIDVFECRYAGGRVRLDGPTDHRWILLEETAHYAFPRANHKFIKTLRERALGPERRGGRRAAPRRRRDGI